MLKGVKWLIQERTSRAENRVSYVRVRVFKSTANQEPKITIKTSRKNIKNAVQ